MAVLSVGLEAPPDALELARKFGIDLDRYNFARTSSFTPVTTNREGVYVCGAFQSPRPFPIRHRGLRRRHGAARALLPARGTLAGRRRIPRSGKPRGKNSAWGCSSAPAASTSPGWWTSKP